MQKLILLSIFLIISLNAFSEEKKQFAKLMGSYQYSYPRSDGRGNILALTEKNVVSLIGSDGLIVRQVTPPLPQDSKRGGFYIPTRAQALFLNVDDKFEFYSTEKEVHKIATFQASKLTNGHPLALKNGNVLANYRDGSLKVLTPKGEVAFETKLESVGTGVDYREFSDGTIVLSGLKKLFLSPELKLIKQNDLNCKIPSYYGHAFPSTMHIAVCDDRAGKVNFLTSSGDIKYTFKPASGLLKSYAFLPNNFTALMFTDGYIYFLDAVGNKKYTHFHDTAFYSDLALVSDKVLAYWNKSEIVYLDFQGNELGTLAMPRIREDHEGPKQLIGLGNGTLVAVDGFLVHFIKMN